MEKRWHASQNRARERRRPKFTDRGLVAIPNRRYLVHLHLRVRPADEAVEERWDGGGYPDGIAGEAIPIEARIVFVCDAFNAMTTERAYRAARTAGEAVAELRACSGTQFDPHVVDALAGVLAN